MKSYLPKTKAAVVQAGPCLFDLSASLEKAERLISEAGQHGARIILFPEAFLSGYPRGLSFGAVVGSRSQQGRQLFQRYWENAVEDQGEATSRLGEAARKANAFLAMGVIERDSETSGGTLYCSLFYFSPNGELIGKHRKLKPTGSERLIWGEGGADTLTVIKTEFGRIAGLICWENYMPLARMALYSQGIDIYLAPTADARDTWQASMQHIACEGRCFVLGCNQFVVRDMYPADLIESEEMHNQPEIMCRGGSVIVSPLGNILAGPLFDEEGILYAELDLAEVVQGRFDFDVVGHYARPDLFDFRVNW